MATIRKFTFDLDFDAPPPPVRGAGFDWMDVGDLDGVEMLPSAEPVYEEPPPPPPPTFSEEEMEAARAEGFVAGRTAALNETAAVSAQAMAEATQAVANGIARLGPAMSRAASEIAELASHVVMEICRKLLPHAAEQFAAQEIEALVGGLLPLLVDQPRLTVRVHPRLADDLRGTLGDLAERIGFEGRLVVIETPNLPPSDTRIEWSEGGAERNTTRLWQAVDEIVERTLPRFTRFDATEEHDNG